MILLVVACGGGSGSTSLPDGSDGSTVGGPCTTANQACDYGGVCSVLAGLPSLTCDNGHWSRQAVGVLCAQHACGTVN